MKPVGIALVGAGPWGLTLAGAFARVRAAELRWICEVDASRRDGAASAHPSVRTTASLEDVLADLGVTAVAVAVDSARHHSVAMRALTANRHVYVEKPLAVSAVDAAELHAAALAARRLLAVGHLLLHHPAIRRARQIVAQDALGGGPLHFESIRETVGAPRTVGSAWWALAPHDVSLALHLFDATPVTVSATGGAYMGDGNDGVASAMLGFADGRTARVRVGRFAGEKTRRVSIAGTTRTLIFDELARERALQVLEAGAAAPTSIRIDEVDPLLAQCHHFVTHAARADASGGNGAHGLAVVRVLEAGARSMREGGGPIDVA